MTVKNVEWMKKRTEEAKNEKKDINWLKDKIQEEKKLLREEYEREEETNQKFFFNNGASSALWLVEKLIDKLDE